jgi:hypothetical protein
MSIAWRKVWRDQMQTSFRWELVSEDEWRDGKIAARADYAKQRMYSIERMKGDWSDVRWRWSAGARSARHRSRWLVFSSSRACS